MKNFISLILLTFDNLELEMKRILKFDQRASFLEKLIENAHHCGKLLTLYFDINVLFLTAFTPLENASKVKKVVEWNMVSYSFPKVKMRYVKFFLISSSLG